MTQLDDKLKELQALADSINEPAAITARERVIHPAFEDTIYGQNPAAGANFTFTIPGEYAFRPKVIYCQMVTSAVVAARIMHLQFLDADSRFLANYIISSNQAASLTRDYTWAETVGYAAPVSSAVFVTGITPITMQPGWKIRLLVLSIDIGDQVKNITMTGDKYFTGEEGNETLDFYQNG